MKASTTKERLQQLMDKYGYRQIDILNKCKPFCQKYGVRLGRNDISQYLSGKVIPSQRKLSILAMGLGVDETWLMGYDFENSEERYIYESYESLKQSCLRNVFFEMGYDYYHIAQAFDELPTDGQKEMISLVDYLINKYGITESILSKNDADVLFLESS